VFQVNRSEDIFIVTADVDSVISCLKMGDWGWKTSWAMASDGAQVLEVKGHYLRDNDCSARIEVRAVSNVQTKLTIEGVIGERTAKVRTNSPLANTSFMRNVLSPEKNLGMKRFKKNVGDKAYEMLTKKLY
jgi:hypothetical protein